MLMPPMFRKPGTKSREVQTRRARNSRARALLQVALWLLICGAVGGALMIMEAHYLGDLIAGTLLRVTVGSVCRRITRM
jgi:membrane-associated phospholipid phosphatase